MTNQELIEKIVRLARIRDWRTCSLEARWENHYCKDRECSDCVPDRILALVIEALPELAKEAGYVLPGKSDPDRLEEFAPGAIERIKKAIPPEVEG